MGKVGSRRAIDRIMTSSPETRATLLLRLRDVQDHLAWSQFVEIYGPLIFRCALRQGLQDADAADVTQEVLQAVARHMGTWEYDPRSGQFRGWLFTIARHKIADFRQKRRRSAVGSGDSNIHEILVAQADDSSDREEDWNREYEQRLFHWAADQIRPEFQESTWQAFWKTAVENREGKAVASELGLSVGAVYIAKSRVLTRLREKIHEVGEP